MVRALVKSLLVAGGMLFASSSFANTEIPLYHKCSMHYDINSFAFFAEAGKGKAEVTCEDNTGSTVTQFKVRMLGLGVTFGKCTASGNIVASGVGFTMSDFIRAMGSVELGLLLGQKLTKQYSVGATFNPLLNASITAGSTETSGCVGLGSVKGFKFYNL